MFIKKVSSYEFATQDWKHFWLNRAYALLTDILWLFSGIILFFITQLVMPFS